MYWPVWLSNRLLSNPSSSEFMYAPVVSHTVVAKPEKESSKSCTMWSKNYLVLFYKFKVATNIVGTIKNIIVLESKVLTVGG